MSFYTFFNKWKVTNFSEFFFREKKIGKMNLSIINRIERKMNGKTEHGKLNDIIKMTSFLF